MFPCSGHCKKLAPEYIKAAATLAAMDPPRYIAKVDATENSGLQERFGVKGFPTLHFFVKGERTDYTGGRDEATIVQWISKRTGPPSTEIACDAIADKVTQLKLGLFFFGCTDSDMFKSFQEAGQSSVGEKFAFFHAHGDCAEKLGAAAQGIALVRNFDNSPIIFSGDATSKGIQDFATAHSVPTLITFSDDYVEPIFGNRQAALFLFQEDASAGFNKVFEDAANQLKGQILFVTSGVSEGIQSKLADFIGVTKADLPTLRLLDPAAEMAKYKFEGSPADITVESLQAYLNDFKGGKLTPFLKSEPVPETQGAVTTVVGTTYKEIVMDPTKDVLVKFYAPWCGHCKKLAPIWNELGEAVKDIDDLVIADFDATANEATGVEIRGYPTLKFYPKTNKRGVDYDGDRELPDFLNWLGEKSSAYKTHLAKSADAPKQEEL